MSRRYRGGTRLSQLHPDMIREIARLLSSNRNAAALALTSRSTRNATRNDMAQRRQVMAAKVRRVEPIFRDIQTALPWFAQASQIHFPLHDMLPGTQLRVDRIAWFGTQQIELSGRYGQHRVSVVRHGFDNPHTFRLHVDVTRGGKKVAILEGTRGMRPSISGVRAWVSRYMTPNDVQVFRQALRAAGVNNITVEAARFQRNPPPLQG